MRISDWSSDVCSSDLFQKNRIHADVSIGNFFTPQETHDARFKEGKFRKSVVTPPRSAGCRRVCGRWWLVPARKSVVEGKSVSVRVDLGGRRIIKKKNKVVSKDNDNEEEKTNTI